MYLQEQYPHSLINFTILKKIKDKQLILLYLKFESNAINFESFSSQYKISYDSYHHILKSLKRQQIVRQVNKNNSKFKTYKLIKESVEIFPHASRSDEKLVYQSLHSSSSTTPITADINSYIQIVLNPNALQILKHIKKKYNSKPFKRSSIVGNNSTTTNERAFKFLIDHNALRKVPLAPHTYVLSEFYDQALQQDKLKKNPPIFNYANLNSVIKDTKWSKYCNIHDLEILAQFEGLYNDLKYSNQYDSTGDRIIFLKNELIYNTHVTVLVYPKKTIIMIRCSEKPILANDLLRFNRILAEIIGHINNNHFTKEYDYDYHNFTVVKHDYALDGKLHYRLKKGSLIKDSPYSYKNTDGQDIIPYVKKNYKSSNSSWVRSERRAVNPNCSVYDFRKMILNSKLNISPCS